jgi:hypothetical protein
MANAIYGSLVMVSLATFVGTPIGIMAGIYLAEYDVRSWLAQVTRFVNDICCRRPVHRDRPVCLRRRGGRGSRASLATAG